MPDPASDDPAHQPSGRNRPPSHWADLTPAERVAAVVGQGLPGFRAKQLSAHYFGHWSAEPASWTDLSLAHRQQVGHFFPELLRPVEERQTDGGSTVKSLFRLHDDALIESVLMRYGDPPAPRHAGAGSAPPTGLAPLGSSRRTTLCLSTQAGCGMDCPFCATGQLGLRRNLSTGEIVEQVRHAGQSVAGGGLPGGPGRLSNIVVMGMGEPLANYDAVLKAVRQITTPVPDGWGVSARGVTISTVGLVPGMRRLAGEGLPITMALSLHAPDDALRDELVPMNRRFNVSAVLDAAWDYARLTKRRVSIEYALIDGINDQPSRAGRLARELRGRGDWGWFHVNVIPLNPTPGSKWTAATPEAQTAFVAALERAHVPVTVRDTRGRDIDGACGQLASGANAVPQAGWAAGSSQSEHGGSGGSGGA